MDHDLELSVEEMRAMGEAALERCVAHIASLAAQPSRGDVDCQDVCASLSEQAPEDARDFEAVLARIFDELVPRSFTTPGPGYLAYVPGGGLFPAAIADLISNATNRYIGVWQAAPALATIEGVVLDWLRDWMEMPQGTSGLLTPGASISTLIALVTAREHLLGPDFRDGVVYVSDQVHHCVTKSARVVGIAPDRVRRVASDAAYRLRPEHLCELVAADRALGLRPFCAVSTAGTTNTGAVDPIDAVADICEREGLWHHVDAAYGGFFYAVPELRSLMPGLPRADSLALDPHKGLFLPYGTGALLVRNGALLRAAHAERADYLPELPEGEFYDPSLHGPELSRPFRALRVWLCVQVFGMRKIRAAIKEKRELTLRAYEALRDEASIKIVTPPDLSLFAWYVRSASGRVEDDDAATRQLVERVTARGKVMISGCVTGGRYLARICVLSFRTHADRIEDFVTAVREEARDLER